MILLAATTLALALWRDESPPSSNQRRRLATWTGWSCPEGPPELVDWLVGRGEEIDHDEFAEHVDLETATFLDPWQREILPTDWSVTFLRTRLPSGLEAWVLQHSGIEHLFFSPDAGELDLENEADLAEALTRWIDSAPVSRQISDLSPAEIHQILRELATPSPSQLTIGDWVTVIESSGARRTGRVSRVTRTTFDVRAGSIDADGEFLGRFARRDGVESVQGYALSRPRYQLRRVHPLPKGLLP